MSRFQKICREEFEGIQLKGLSVPFLFLSYQKSVFAEHYDVTLKLTFDLLDKSTSLLQIFSFSFIIIILIPENEMEGQTDSPTKHIQIRAKENGS